MKFTSPLTTLEFYINHRLGGGEPVNHDAIVAAVDIEKIMDRFPANLQKSLIDFTIDGKVNRFTFRTLRHFAHKLADAGYLMPISDSAISVAA